MSISDMVDVARVNWPVPLDLTNMLALVLVSGIR